MLASIHPLGERVRRNRWGLTVTAFAVGSLLAGMVVGALAGTLGIGLRAVPSRVLGVVALAGIAVAVLADVAPRRVRLPNWHRQVNEDWMERYRGWVYGAGFGLQLGAGFLTIITTAAVHLTFFFAILTRSPLGGALVGLTFGLVRGVSPVVTARTRDADALRRLHRRLERIRPAAQLATVAGMLGVGIATSFVLIAGAGA